MSESVNQEITTQEVIAELQRGIRVFKAFEHAEAVCTRLAGLEQNERELTERLGKLRADVEQAEAGVFAATERAGEIVRDANSEAAQIIANANASAAAALSDASKEAERIVVNASDRAGEADARRTAAEIALADLEEKIRAAGSELETLNSRLDAVRKERDRLLSV